MRSLGGELKMVVSHCGCRELLSGPLQDQQTLLAAEPSLQPLLLTLNHIYVYVRVSAKTRGVGSEPGATGGCGCPNFSITQNKLSCFNAFSILLGTLPTPNTQNLVILRQALIT